MSLDERPDPDMGPFAVVTGGGTAGHVLPALAVAEALVDRGRRADEILYAGCKRGIEVRLLPSTPFPAVFYDVVGFQRSLTRRNIAFIPKMITATRQAIKKFRQDRPAVVVSVGGYASMPSVFAARRLKIPVGVVSYDRTPGRASQLSAKHAVVGPNRFLVAVMGGSQGSGVLNGAIAKYLADRADDGELSVRQVAGERFIDTIDQVGSGDAHATGVQHRLIGYEDDMPSVYEAADLLIGRGGASTVHEVAVTGTPAILVPWSNAADDHQTDNVGWLTDVEAAVLVPESNLGRLGDEIERLRSDGGARKQLSDAALARGDVHRSGALAALIERVALTSAAS